MTGQSELQAECFTVSYVDTVMSLSLQVPGQNEVRARCFALSTDMVMPFLVDDSQSDDMPE